MDETLTRHTERPKSSDKHLPPSVQQNEGKLIKVLSYNGGKVSAHSQLHVHGVNTHGQSWQKSREVYSNRPAFSISFGLQGIECVPRGYVSRWEKDWQTQTGRARPTGSCRWLSPTCKTLSKPTGIVCSEANP